MRNCLLITLTCTLAVSGYVLPAHKMAIDDQSYVNLKGLDEDAVGARNDVIRSDIQPSVHRYNMYWDSFETAVQSSETAIECPAGYTMFPADATGLVVNGGRYNRYHCYSDGTTELARSLLRADHDQGWQSAAIAWCPPRFYRDPSCLGMPEGGSEAAPDNFTESYAIFRQVNQGTSAQIESFSIVATHDSPLQGNATLPGAAAESAFDALGCSCVPTDAAMPDYRDFALYMVTEIPEAGSNEFTHFIVSNEVANSIWHDMSPEIDVTQPLTSSDQQKWIDKYVSMMRAFIDVVGSKSLVYTSIDRWFGVPPVLTDWHIGRVHMGSKNLLIGLWNALGTSYPWAIASHVYGDVDAHEFNGENGIVEALTFATVNDLAAFQRQQLQRVSPSLSDDPAVTPQMVIAATEQGVQNTVTGESDRAKYICQAYAQTKASPNLFWVAFNDFQTDGSDTWGLVSNDVDDILSSDSTSKDLAYAAYRATNDLAWGIDSQNYCCVTFQLGCP